ncbi:Zn-ribbon domain-containing OB-fold protein [Spirillospora sp. CA-294931]|uniref:Zn-ribbon domain-containing OB-fold protein n=1 Tax=Spirillospora sp. CA-294931 TaxID=3240042 RepID=UPI003D8C482C
MDLGILRRDGRTDPFFDGTAADRLMIKRCEPCERPRGGWTEERSDEGSRREERPLAGERRRAHEHGRWFGPDATACPSCGSEDLAWAEADGRATLVTWTVLHGRPGADGTPPPPALLALVELSEGPWLHTRLVEVDAVDLREGLPLRATFVHPEEGESYVLFRP